MNGESIFFCFNFAEVDIKEIQEYYDNLAHGLCERFVLKFTQGIER